MDRLFDLGAILRQAMAQAELLTDAVRVGSAIGKALTDSGCEVIKVADIAADVKEIHAVSPAGMEFKVSITAIGVRCLCGKVHDDADRS